jgi:short-chain Z-isoprenyl diphosphate synthase
MMLRLLYRLYERRLRRQIRTKPVPRHVGIILDGHRRFARKHGFISPRRAYDIGADKLDDVLTWCIEIGIPAVTLWACSIDNLKRSPSEVAEIFAAIEAKITGLAEDPSIQLRRIRLKAAGRLDLLPTSTIAAIRRAEEVTCHHDALTVTIAIAYGGREEIADAVRELIRDKAQQGASLEAIVESITPAAIDKHLYTAGLPDPDLLIRTSGEIRLSGFLLWQSAQSEFYFSDVNWPEFRKIDFLRAVRSFQQRTRRFGR